MKASVLAAVLSVSDASRSSSSMKMYEDFRRQFGVERREQDEVSYLARVALFEQRQAEVARHNAQPGIAWEKAINKFSDYTPEEFTVLLGHRPLRRAAEEPAAAAPSASFLQLRPKAPLSASVDWQAKLTSNISKVAKNQGGCGSCWAVASAGALETHAEAKLGKGAAVSYEQLVSCTPNPQECGGQGGCKGATAELALEYVKEHGVVAQGEYKGYQSGGDEQCHQPSAKFLTISGYTRLPENKMQPLMEALSKDGPVVVSASASMWGAYSKGVFDGCQKDSIINHAILAMGYGKDDKLNKAFWLIRNSWGPDWGEGGYIRLLRHEEENAYCGTDHKPADGVACKNDEGKYPAEMKVCGMCGILSDSAYPTGVAFA